MGYRPEKRFTVGDEVKHAICSKCKHALKPKWFLLGWQWRCSQEYVIDFIKNIRVFIDCDEKNHSGQCNDFEEIS